MPKFSLYIFINIINIITEVVDHLSLMSVTLQQVTAKVIQHYVAVKSDRQY